MDSSSFKQTAGSSTSDAPPILGALGALQTGSFYLVILPLKLLFGQALPWILVNLFNVILYILSWLWTVVRIGLWPVLFPLDILFVRPATAVLLLIYQSRYFIYFIVVAVLAGTAMGYLCSALTSSSHTPSSSSKIHSKKSERTQRQQIPSSKVKQTAESSSDDEEGVKEVQRSKINSRHVKNKSEEDRFAAAMQSLTERRRRIGGMS